jgi:hypothetical protein
MKPIYDYFYRFPQRPPELPGRCRVRIYKRRNGAQTVLLTEVYSDSGESITNACERIATELVASKGLNPKTTRWIQHDPAPDDLPLDDPPTDDQAQIFDEVSFTWDTQNQASDPRWQRMDEMQVEALTGESMIAMSRRLGDLEFSTEGGSDYEPAQAKGTA